MTTHTKTPWEKNPFIRHNITQVMPDNVRAPRVHIANCETDDDAVTDANIALIVHRVNGWDEQQAKIDELASSLDKALEEVSRVDIWGEPHQPTIDFVNRCLELIALTRAKGV